MQRLLAHLLLLAHPPFILQPAVALDSVPGPQGAPEEEVLSPQGNESPAGCSQGGAAQGQVKPLPPSPPLQTHWAGQALWLYQCPALTDKLCPVVGGLGPLVPDTLPHTDSDRSRPGGSDCRSR